MYITLHKKEPNILECYYFIACYFQYTCYTTFYNIMVMLKQRCVKSHVRMSQENLIAFQNNIAIF